MSVMRKTWTIDAEGVLTIRAGFRKRKGKPDFYARREEIKAIVVEKGVEELAESAFQDCSHVRHFHLPATLRSIGYLALHVGEGHLLSIDVAKGNGRKPSAIVAPSPR